jgi:hypothetical protein
MPWGRQAMEAGDELPVLSCLVQGRLTDLELSGDANRTTTAEVHRGAHFQSLLPIPKGRGQRLLQRVVRWANHA